MGFVRFCEIAGGAGQSAISGSVNASLGPGLDVLDVKAVTADLLRCVAVLAAPPCPGFHPGTHACPGRSGADWHVLTSFEVLTLFSELSGVGDHNLFGLAHKFLEFLLLGRCQLACAISVQNRRI